MDRNVRTRNVYKRKRNTDERISYNNNNKRIFRDSPARSSTTRITRSSECNAVNDTNLKSFKGNNSAQSRLKQFSVNNRLQSSSIPETLNKNSRKEWFSSDLRNQINNATISTPFKQVPPAKNIVDFSSETSNKYSARGRLRSLRNRIVNNAPAKEWFQSDVPDPLRNSNSFVQNRLKNIVEKPVPNKRYCFRSQYTVKETTNSTALKKPFEPFQPITMKTLNASGEDQALTDYDDSESAADFGNNVNESFTSVGCNSAQFGNKTSRINHIRQEVDRLNQEAKSEFAGQCKTDSRLNNYREHDVNTFYSNTDTSHEPSNRNELQNVETYSINDHLRFSATTKVPTSVNEETNITKFQNTRTRIKPYSANDRLRNIQKSTVVNNKLLENLTTYTTNTTQSDKPLTLTKPTRIISSRSSNSSINEIDNIISNISDNLQKESPINKTTSTLPQQSFLSARLSNIKNSTLRRTTTNFENFTFALPVSDRPQMNGYSNVKRNSFGNQSLNFFSSNNKPNIFEEMSKRMGNYERMSSSSQYSLPEDEERCCDEPMEWSTINESETLSNLQILRKTVTESEEITRVPQTTFQEIVAKTSPEMPHNMTILKEIYIVVDTNIFISHLRIVKRLLDIKINEPPIIMIPWMVIQELDYIKDGRSGDSLKGKARDAIRFINHRLTHKDPYVKGQSVMDAAKQEVSSKNPDDGILHCCLQIIKKRNKATLLSNDVNLRNKALLNGIAAYGHDRIIDVFDPYHFRNGDHTIHAPKEDRRITELKTYLSEMCSTIIVELLKQDYGSVWENLKPTAPPPWTLYKCLELFKEYWIPVFSMHLPKQYGKLIDDFTAYIKTRRDGIIPIEDSEQLMEFSLALCVFLKNGLPVYKSVVDLCINNIQNVAL